MSDSELPLFPLSTVLFPDGRLALQIFEPRYLDLIKSCSRSGLPFGVCAQHRSLDPTLSLVGCTAHIVDFSVLENGLLGIEVVGRQRFNVLSVRSAPDQLLIAKTAPIDPEAVLPIPAEFGLLSSLVAGLMSKTGRASVLDRAHLDNATWLGFRLAEFLPLQLGQQQSLLEMQDPLLRLRTLLAWLPEHVQD